MINVQHLTKSHGGLTAADNVSFVCDSGNPPRITSGAIDVSADGPPSFGRLAYAELRKMTDTVSGRALMIGTVVVGIVVNIGMLILNVSGHASDLNYFWYLSGAGAGLRYLMPAMVILLVTSEWTHRVAATTFALVPNRGRVLAAKLASAIAVTLVGFVVTAGFAAVTNLASGAFTDSPTAWAMDMRSIAESSLPFVYFATMAFAFGLLVLNSAGALVGFYLASFALPPIIMSVSGFGRLGEVLAWVDPNAVSALGFDPSGSNWAHFAVSATIWVFIPLAIGVRRVLTSEIK